MLQNKEPKAPLCSDKTKQIQRLVEDFVKNQIDEINLFSLGNIAVIVRIMRDKIVSCEEEKAKLNNLLTETAESKINKSEGGTILEKTSSFKFVPTIISKPDNGQLQTVPQITSAKDLVKNSHSKKNVLQSKSHKKESMENDSKSISKKGRISSSSLNGPKRSSTLSKKKIGGVADSITSAEKTDKKKASENQQPTSALLNTANSILPDTTPERQDAMREYILSDKTMYKTAMEIFTKYDNEARNIYENYLKEIKTLNGLFEILELRKHELVQSKLVRQFSRKEEFDGDGNVVKSELEIKCHENINQAEQKVIKQQEIVLNLQAELKLLLAMRQQQRDEVKAEFEEFCKEKYNLPTPNLDDINETVFENEVPFEELCEQVEVDRMIENVTQEAVYVEIYKNFKHLMFNEAKRKAMFLRKSIKWIENTRQQIPTTTNT
ncbi:hypothetical protein HHI36_008577 [Cryptolaemus montrouzieri]|uniref:Uncharacterized protein n=1 Tax=Cryptolaemus montrouzieri TaxID=559131 RepID=A0ABD2MSZ9_9CUCU